MRLTQPRQPPRATRLHRRARLLCTALGAGLVLLTLLWARPRQRGGSGKGLPAGDDAASAVAASADPSNPLLSRIEADLRPFQLSGISRRMVEQVYCQASRGSMRVQVINGSVYIVGESPSYESRLLSLKRQLLQLWLAGQLPEGIDLVLEQEDGPTVRNRSDDCPNRGPLLAPAKQPANASHAHVLLAPDHSFAGWLEAHTLSWAEMLPLLQHAARRRPWEERSNLLFFRGAATGHRNLSALSSLVNRTSAEERPRFVSLADHCRHKLLLHLAGNTYAARLKYLLACGAAVVAPESGWSEFWHHLLRPGEHFIAVEEVDEFNRGHHLADVAADLQQDDPLARRLGMAGAALVARELVPTMVQAYWQRLLEGYRQLQEFNATLHPDAVPLERSILVPEVRNVTRRTCRVCAPTKEQLLEQRRADLGLKGDEPLPQLVLPVWEEEGPQQGHALGGGGGERQGGGAPLE